MNSDGKVQSVVLFLVSKLFTKKLNAIGISNLPAAVRSYQDTKKEEAKKKAMLYASSIFHSMVVVSGFLDRWPILIKTSAIGNIVSGVKVSIDTRKEKEAKQLAKQLEADAKQQSKGESFSFSRFIKNKLLLSDDQVEEVEKEKEVTPEKVKKSKTEKAQKTVKRTKSILKGKRDTATDDLIWGAFQISFVCFDQTVSKALAYAWMMFLLTVLEESLLNPKLDKKQRGKRLLWLVAMGWMSGKLVIPEGMFGEENNKLGAEG